MHRPNTRVHTKPGNQDAEGASILFVDSIGRFAHVGSCSIVGSLQVLIESSAICSVSTPASQLPGAFNVPQATTTPVKIQFLGTTQAPLIRVFNSVSNANYRTIPTDSNTVEEFAIFMKGNSGQKVVETFVDEQTGRFGLTCSIAAGTDADPEAYAFQFFTGSQGQRQLSNWDGVTLPKVTLRCANAVGLTADASVQADIGVFSGVVNDQGPRTSPATPK